MRAMYRFLGALVLALAATGASSAGIVEQARGSDGPWDYVGFDAAHHRVLIARGDGVVSLDTATNILTAFAPGARVHAVIALPDGRILTTNGTANTATLINGTSGRIEATVGVGIDPDAAVYDPATRSAFVMNAHSGDISVIDLRSAREVSRVQVGGALEFAVVDGQGRLFVNAEDRNEIVVFDTVRRRVTARYPLAGCNAPTAMAYVAAYHLLITACGNGHAFVLRSTDGRPIADLAIGPHPDQMVYDAGRRVAYIPTAGSAELNGEIAVVSITGPTSVSVTAHIPTSRGTRTIAEDPATGRLYLPTADYAVTTAGRPQPAPGTFRVLVVQP